MTPNPFSGLLHSRKFWLAVVGLVQTILFQFVPDFPKEVWLSIDALLAIVIVGIAYEDGQANRAAPQAVPLISDADEQANDELKAMLTEMNEKLEAATAGSMPAPPVPVKASANDLPY
jgi:hypothetical protein